MTTSYATKPAISAQPAEQPPAAAPVDPAGTVATLARQLPSELILDAEDVAAAIESMGVSDRTAQQRYGVPSVFALGEAVLSHLREMRPHRGVRRAPPRRRYLLNALLRCALYLGPLSAAVAAGDRLTRISWWVPAVTLLLGWTAAQALASAGAAVSCRAGSGPAVRLVAGGFAAAAGLWCALVWVAPDALIGADRLLAALVGLAGLACFGTVTAALVARIEVAVVRWSLPLWLIAAVTVADGWSAQLPSGPVLLAGIALAAGRAFRPALRPTPPVRPLLGAADVRRAGCYAIVGLAQTVSVVLLWRSAATGSPSPAVLPLLATVPLLEALVGWHAVQVDAGLDRFQSVAAYVRHLRGVTVVTVAGLLPPLAVGAALAAAAYRLPYGLSAQLAARDLVLALAGGTLLGGVLTATLLLAARGRVAVAAAVAATPATLTALALLLPAGWLAVTTASGTPDVLPTLVAMLAVTHLIGLLSVAHTAIDPRRTS